MPEFLPDLPVDRILARYAASPGSELNSSKFDSPDSSAFLVANAFGWFLERPEMLPAFPGFGGPKPFLVEVEHEMRFPWAGGRHPWLDVAVETESLLIGVESKRYEPFRPGKSGTFSEAYTRDVWGDRMGRYSGLMRQIATEEVWFDTLDAVQLIKHAFGLRNQGVKRARQPVLLYLFAEPPTWASTGKPVDPVRIALHRAEAERFAGIVAGDQVQFVPLLWEEMLDIWAEIPALRAHVAAIRAKFGALG
jgi:hypothetical protein